MDLSLLASSIKGSATIGLNAKAQQLRAEGKKVFNFTVGEPDFNTFEIAKEAGIKAIKENKSRYTDASGILELKNAISEKFRRENNLEYSAKQIIVNNGAKQSLYNVFLAILNNGDEVLIPKPAWLSYKEQIALAGGKTVFVDSGKNFEIKAENLRESVTSKTSAILINSPNNPTGAVIKKSELEKIAELAIEKNLIVISDECYEHFTYGGEKCESIASFGKEIYERTLTVNSVSKTYAMTGWRIGYIGGPENIIKGISNIQSHTTGNPCNIAQYAAIEAFKVPKSEIEERAREFDKRRKILISEFKKIPEIELVEPKGAFFGFPYINKIFNGKIENSTEFCSYLLNKVNVLVVPGIEFENDNCFRISYTTAENEIVEGIEKIKSAVAEL